jgi:hypothetical protein
MTFHALPHGKRRKSNGHSTHRRQVCYLSAACTLCNLPRGRGTSCVFCCITCLGLRLLRTSRAPTGTCNIPRNTHLSKKHVSSVVYYRTMLSGPSAWRRLQAWLVPHASRYYLLPQLVFNAVANPLVLWERFNEDMAEDFLYQARQVGSQLYPCMALHVSLPCGFAWSWFACCVALNAHYVVCVFL